MRPHLIVTAALLACVPAAASAQAAPATYTNAEIISAAVLPLPAEMRAGARVLGFEADGFTTTVLRAGTNGMTCLGPNPTRTDFHVACYQDALEPFMARGRELRKSGVLGPRVDSVRYAEAASGALVLPKGAASLYSLSGGSFDATEGTAVGARPLFVIYVPFATTATTGISTRPSATSPWLMDPGTPKAHIMFTPTM